MRTDASRVTENNLTGVREIGEDYTDRIDEVHGMYDTPTRSLQRIPGKLLATTGAVGGPVWGLHQLRFRERFGMLSHEGASLYAGDEPLPLSGIVFPYPPDVVQTFPEPGYQIQAADWPWGYVTIPDSNPMPGPVPSGPDFPPIPESRTSEEGVTYTTTPTSIIFYGPQSGSQVFVFRVEGNWPEFGLAWNTDLPAWLSLSWVISSSEWDGSYVEYQGTVSVDPSITNYSHRSYELLLQVVSEAGIEYSETISISMTGVTREHVRHLWVDSPWWPWAPGYYGMVYDEVIHPEYDISYLDPYYIISTQFNAGGWDAYLNLFYTGGDWYLSSSDYPTQRIEGVSFTDSGFPLWQGAYGAGTVTFPEAQGASAPEPTTMFMDIGYFFGGTWKNDTRFMNRVGISNYIEGVGPPFGTFRLRKFGANWFMRVATNFLSGDPFVIADIGWISVNPVEFDFDTLGSGEGEYILTNVYSFTGPSGPYQITFSS